MHDIFEGDIAAMFNIGALRRGDLKIELEDGESGDVKLMLRGEHARMVTVSEEEFSVVTAMLPNFYAYYYMNPKSYLLPIYGCFTLQIGPVDAFSPQHFLLLPEVVASASDITPDCRVLAFNLSGSPARKTIS